MSRSNPASETENTALSDLRVPDGRDEASADRVADEVFGGEANAEQTGALITRFVASYERNKDRQALDEWLTAEFRQYPTLWRDEAELESTAREIIAAVEASDAARASLQAHLDQGKSRESWLARRIEEGAAAAGVVQVGDYARQIDQALLEANVRSLDAIYTRQEDWLGDWSVSASPHLHGFLAEIEVANQFNLDAGAAQADVVAEVVGSTGLNSADLVIRDASGRLLQDVQVKSYADVEQAISNIRAHDYRAGTTLLVHEDQVEPVQRAFPHLRVTSRLEAGGVVSEMPSYGRLKTRQYAAQSREEARYYEWNDVNRISIAKGIGKQALIGAGIVAGMQGVRILARRVWNAVVGRRNPPVSEDLKEFFESSLKSGGHVGARVAVSGAVVVVAKSGWLGAVLKGTPVGRIANLVYVGMENAKILYKFAQGEVSGVEAVDAMGNVSCSTLGGLAGAGLGMSKGATIGAGLGPIGAVVGGLVGGVIGGMAGSKIGEAIYAGGKAIVRTAAKVLKTVWEGAKETAKAIGRALNPMTWFA